jgi:putative membrane protein insertion efficiency factor
MTRVSVWLVRAYRAVLSPLFGLFSTCRYQPTCSEYALGSLRRFGFRRGWWMAIRRVSRCAPWGGYGYDPVPDQYVTWRDRRRQVRSERIQRTAA